MRSIPRQGIKILQAASMAQQNKTKPKQTKNLGEKKRDHGICPITSWQIDGETVEAVTDFIFLGSKITADGDCSREIKSHSLEEKL